MGRTDNWFKIEGTAALHTSVMRQIGQIAGELFDRERALGWEYGFFITEDGVRYFGRKSAANFWPSMGAVLMDDEEQDLNLTYEPLAVFNAAILRVLASECADKLTITGVIPEVPHCEKEVEQFAKTIVAEYRRQLRTGTTCIPADLPTIPKPDNLDFRG